MVRLNGDQMRYLTREHWRVLTAIEMGMKNHQLVPTDLIARIAALKRGGIHKCISHLAKNRLIVHENKSYDGYKLTYAGYDYLALKALVGQGVITGIGRKIGIGKESDIYEVLNEEGEELVLKVHRLGRVCFRSVKKNRDYLQNRQHASWLYLSRLAASREYSYMVALEKHDFPVPHAYGYNRHCIVMNKIKGVPMCQMRGISNPEPVYNKLMNTIVRFAEYGLIHGDYNEFNLMIDPETHKLTVIDFPQMISTSHYNAKHYFDRDVKCIRTWFKKRYKYESLEWPEYFNDRERTTVLDTELKLSGHTTTDQEIEIAAFNEILQAKVDGELVANEDAELEADSDDEPEQDPEQEQEGDVKANPAAPAAESKQLEEDGEEADDEEEESEEESEEEDDPKARWLAEKARKKAEFAARKAAKALKPKGERVKSTFEKQGSHRPKNLGSVTRSSHTRNKLKVKDRRAKAHTVKETMKEYTRK